MLSLIFILIKLSFCFIKIDVFSLLFFEFFSWSVKKVARFAGEEPFQDLKRTQTIRNTDFFQVILYKNTQIVIIRLIQISTDDDRIEKTTISEAQRSESFCIDKSV